jgi:hypothetical protein
MSLRFRAISKQHIPTAESGGGQAGDCPSALTAHSTKRIGKIPFGQNIHAARI